MSQIEAIESMFLPSKIASNTHLEQENIYKISCPR